MVHTQKTTLFLLITTLGTVIAHAIGLWGGGYLYVPHFDTFVHILAGCWIGFVIVYTKERFNFFHASPGTSIVIVGALTLVVGFGWELFEFLVAKISLTQFNVQTPIQPSIADTLKDLMTDVAGGTIAATLSVPALPSSDRCQKDTSS